MRNIFISIIIVLSFGCNSLSDKSSFTGNWKLIQSNGIYFNVCPKIKLVEVSRVIGSVQSDEKSSLLNNKVVFSHENKTNYFTETEFQYRVIYEEGMELLQLVSLDKKNWYLLARDSLLQD